MSPPGRNIGRSGAPGNISQPTSRPGRRLAHVGDLLGQVPIGPADHLGAAVPEQLGHLGDPDAVDQRLGGEGVPDVVADEVLECGSFALSRWNRQRMFWRVNAALPRGPRKSGPSAYWATSLRASSTIAGVR